MLFLGCDPDMHNTAIAMVDETLALKAAWVHRVPKSITGRDAILSMAAGDKSIPQYHQGDLMACAVEAQELYQHGPHRTPNPKSIMYLATIAGMLLDVCHHVSRELYFPTPAEWKGQVPKLVHHKRILHKARIHEYRTAGGKDPYCIPLQVPGDLHRIVDSDWKHIMDAIGLAQYAAEKYTMEKRYAQIANTKGT